MELELEHLAPYLPYQLKLWNTLMEVDFILTISEDNSNSNTIYLEYLLEGKNEYKPILRPLSDLTKEIEVNGEKFIPLIDLYRQSNEHNYNETLDYEFIDSWGAKGNILKVYKNKEKTIYTEFVFMNKSFRKDTHYPKDYNVYQIYLPHAICVNNKIYNQYELFNFLFEWHFDVFGLIEQGLAIDINNL